MLKLVVFSLAILSASADLFQSAYQVMRETAILNSITQTIIANTTKEQDVIVLLPHPDIFADGTFNNLISYSNNLNTNRGNKRKQPFNIIFTRMHYLGQILNALDAKFSDNFNSTIISKEYLGSSLINFNEKFHKFDTSVNNIDYSYKRFLEYSKDISLVSNKTLLKLAKKNIHNNSMISILDDVYSSFSKEGTLLQSILQQGVQKYIVCNKGITPQQLVHGLYYNAVIAELKGLMISSFLNAVQSYLNKRTKTTICENLVKNTLKRVNKLNDVVTLFLAKNRLDRQFYKCSSPSLNNENEYFQFKNFLQMVLVKQNTFGRNHKVLLDHKRCHGGLYGCISAGIWIKPTICLNTTKFRRYDYLGFKSHVSKTGDKITKFNYGKKCLTPTNIPGNTTYNMCLCDETGAKEQERYISLDTVTSDKRNNMVITGVRLLNHLNGVRFQIQQAKLMPAGTVNATTAHWVKIGSTDSKNQFELRQNRRKFDLDVFAGEPGYLVTGAKFSSLRDGVTLQVQITGFNATTGKLDLSNVKWLTNNNSKRQRRPISLTNVYPPSDAKSPAIVQSTSNEFIEFSTTGIAEDVGQTVVPFFDTRPVTPASLVPLSGLGMHYKSAAVKYGGYLSPVVVGLNYIDHMDKQIEDTIASVSNC